MIRCILRQDGGRRLQIVQDAFALKEPDRKNHLIERSFLSRRFLFLPVLF